MEVIRERVRETISWYQISTKSVPRYSQACKAQNGLMRHLMLKNGFEKRALYGTKSVQIRYHFGTDLVYKQLQNGAQRRMI